MSTNDVIPREVHELISHFNMALNIGEHGWGSETPILNVRVLVHFRLRTQSISLRL